MRDLIIAFQYLKEEMGMFFLAGPVVVGQEERFRLDKE